MLQRRCFVSLLARIRSVPIYIHSISPSLSHQRISLTCFAPTQKLNLKSPPPILTSPTSAAPPIPTSATSAAPPIPIPDSVLEAALKNGMVTQDEIDAAYDTAVAAAASSWPVVESDFEDLEATPPKPPKPPKPKQTSKKKINREDYYRR